MEKLSGAVVKISYNVRFARVASTCVQPPQGQSCLARLTSNPCISVRARVAMESSCSFSWFRLRVMRLMRARTDRALELGRGFAARLE